MTTPIFHSRLALRPRDAAQALSISPRHLWQLTHDGKIPCVRLGQGKRRLTLYPIAGLQTWLTEQAKYTAITSWANGATLSGKEGGHA